MQPACNLEHTHVPPVPLVATPLLPISTPLYRCSSSTLSARPAWYPMPPKRGHTRRLGSGRAGHLRLAALFRSLAWRPSWLRVGHLAVPQAPYEGATQKPRRHPAAPDHPGARRQSPTHAATEHAQNATTALEDHWLAWSCPLGPRGEPLPLECRGEAAEALLCLPKVTESTAFDRIGASTPRGCGCARCFPRAQRCRTSLAARRRTSCRVLQHGHSRRSGSVSAGPLT